MATTCSALNAPPSINAVAALTSSGARIPVLNAWQFMVDLLRSGVSVSGRRPPFGEQREHAARVERHLAHAHRSEEHTSELQSRLHLVCRLLLEKKKKK